MDKGNVNYIYNGIVFTIKKEGNSAIWEKWMDWGHYAKWNKSEKTKILYVEYEKVKLIEQRVACSGEGKGEILIKVYKPKSYKINMFWGLM